MPSLTCFTSGFTSSLPRLALVCFFFSLFVCLGFWQIHRANEKIHLIVAQKTREKQKPIPWRQQHKIPLQYERLLIQGTYLPQLFLLDNQHYQHQFGYDILSPLELSDGSVIIVNRGWVPGEPRKAPNPIQIPKGWVSVQGSVYFPSKNQWILGPMWEKIGNKTFLLEGADHHVIHQILQKTILPFIIRLDKHETNGFVREWETVSIPVYRHLIYAVQWFVMALLVLILFTVLNLKKK